MLRHRQENKPHRNLLGDSLLLHIISTCRKYADVLNLSYINSKCEFGYNYVTDLVSRKKPLRDPEKVLMVLDAMIKYCEEVEEFKEKIEAIRNEIKA
jgi:hypothetical protein